MECRNDRSRPSKNAESNRLSGGGGGGGGATVLKCSLAVAAASGTRNQFPRFTMLLGLFSRNLNFILKKRRNGDRIKIVALI